MKAKCLLFNFVPTAPWDGQLIGGGPFPFEWYVFAGFNNIAVLQANMFGKWYKSVQGITSPALLSFSDAAGSEKQCSNFACFKI